MCPHKKEVFRPPRWTINFKLKAWHKYSSIFEVIAASLSLSPLSLPTPHSPLDCSNSLPHCLLSMKESVKVGQQTRNFEVKLRYDFMFARTQCEISFRRLNWKAILHNTNDLPVSGQPSMLKKTRISTRVTFVQCWLKLQFTLTDF